MGYKVPYVPLSYVYRATPPMFLHDSLNKRLHVRNFCQDLHGYVSANVSRRGEATDGVMLFLPVGSSLSSNASRIQRENVHHLNKYWRDHDVFLAFATRSAPDGPETKLQLLWRHWQMYGSSWSASYRYIWAVNEDVDVKDVSPHEMAVQAQAAGTLLTAPVVQDTSRSQS